MFPLILLLPVYLSAVDQDAVNTWNYYKSDFNNRIAKPLTSDTDFVLQNGETFKANLTCSESAKEFLIITYSGTSEISINISVDKSLNGNFTTYTLSGISGICSSAVIKCTPNTWNDCKYYNYSYDGINFSLNQISYQDTSGCYCTNSSCGSPAEHYKRSILGEIGGPISEVFNKFYSSYIISKVDNDNTHVTYYAYDQSTCQNYDGDIGAAYSQTNDIHISQKSETMQTEQSNDENSVYYMTIDSMNNQTENEFDEEISIVKEVNKDITVSGDTSDYSFTYMGKTQSEDGEWVLNNEDGTMQIDFSNPEVKYCLVKWLQLNTQIHTDGTEHTTQNNEIESWQQEIRECTGADYSVCPVNTDKGELIKYPCGEINAFAEATSALTALKEMADDISCSSD